LTKVQQSSDRVAKAGGCEEVKNRSAGEC